MRSIPVHIAAMEALGANVVSMSWLTVPTAMQQGVTDAVEPTPNALVGAGLYEMVDQVTEIGYYYSFYIVRVDKVWWNGLQEETRSGLEEALAAATAWNWENLQAENAATYKTVRLGNRCGRGADHRPDGRAQGLSAACRRLQGIQAVACGRCVGGYPLGRGLSHARKFLGRRAGEPARPGSRLRPDRHVETRPAGLARGKDAGRRPHLARHPGAGGGSSGLLPGERELAALFAAQRNGVALDQDVARLIVEILDGL